MVLSDEQWMRIKHLRLNGLSVGAIARELGLDRKTVRKYVFSDRPPAPALRPPPTSGLDPFKDLVRAKLDAYPELAVTRILEDLQPLGYPGSYTVLQRFVQGIKAAKAVVAYALQHPNLRHRQLAWRAIDEDAVHLSPSTVYRVLKENGLVHEWKRDTPRSPEKILRASRPDERWLTDMTYIRIAEKTFYLITFIDEFSRYITHWEMLTTMDRHAVSLAAETALSSVPLEVRPEIQTDNGSGYISREFKIVLSRRGVTHHRIRPHTPEDNAIVERVEGTVKRELDHHDVDSLPEANEKLADIIGWYNNRRYHSSLNFLPPAVYYRGDPVVILEERRRKLAAARHRRKEQNLSRRQQTLYLTPDMEQGREPGPSESHQAGLSHFG